MKMGTRIAELLAMAEGDRGDFLAELADIATADEAAFTELSDSNATAIGEKDTLIAALEKKVADLTAHNYELMKGVGTSIEATGDDDEPDDEDDSEPFDELFGED